MAEFFGFLKTFVVCGTVYFLAMLVLLSLPQSRLRMVGVEFFRYALAAGLILLAVSPMDLLPDVLPPLTWLDDVGYVGGAIGAIKSALGLRRQRRELEQYELDQFMAHRRPAAQLTESGKEE